MNWGHGIILFFMTFLSFMAFMFYKCMQQDFDLVAENYYAQEIAYQETINQQENANHLATKPVFSLEKDSLSLQFHKAATTGKIYVFRPSDDELDFEEKLILDTKLQQKFPLSKFEKGFYKLRISWEQDQQKYYIEQRINFP